MAEEGTIEKEQRTIFLGGPPLVCDLIFKIILFLGRCGGERAVVAQWGEHSHPTNVARVRFPDSVSYVG